MRFTFLLGLSFVFCSFSSFSQTKKSVYHPCFLMDSVEKNLPFIQQHISRVFADTFDCRQTLLDNIAIEYSRTRDNKYLDALSLIRQNPKVKVQDFYTDIIKRFVETDFSGFLNQFYLARGKYQPLENELINTMNMMIGGRPYKQKYIGLLNVEISKSADSKDKYKGYYLKKLKTKIEEDKH